MKLNTSTRRVLAVIITATAVLIAGDQSALARHQRHHSHHHAHHTRAVHHTRATRVKAHRRSAQRHAAQAALVEQFDNNGRRIFAPEYAPSHSARVSQARETRVVESGITYIPNPPGTWRVAVSCAHRLAAYWGLGHGLDAVATWPRRFALVSAPAVGVAAVRNDRHHIMGIIGGGPGAWVVADFNSGGHLNREYTVSSFPGFFFVDPSQHIDRRQRVASQ